MHYKSLRNHLKPYEMVKRRRTTINHAFAAAVAPHDDYDEMRIREALRVLGQDPDQPLSCAYCGRAAQTWDHVGATVRNREFSGHGHRLGNLLPCCKPCNSAKGNRDWSDFMATLAQGPEHEARRAAIAIYLDTYGVEDRLDATMPEMAQLAEIRELVLLLMQKGDELAAAIRERSRDNQPQPSPTSQEAFSRTSTLPRVALE